MIYRDYVKKENEYTLVVICLESHKVYSRKFDVNTLKYDVTIKRYDYREHIDEDYDLCEFDDCRNKDILRYLRDDFRFYNFLDYCENYKKTATIEFRHGEFYNLLCLCIKKNRDISEVVSEAVRELYILENQ